MLNKIVVAWFQLVIFMICFCLGCKPLCYIMQHLNILTIYNITYLIIYIYTFESLLYSVMETSC